MTNELHGIARLAGATGGAEPATTAARTPAGGFVTTVRHADKIAPFETVVRRAAAENAAGASPAGQAGGAAPSPVIPAANRAAKAQKSFEAFALQVFIGSMLPKENTKLFGTGAAGKMWQAMMAEKLADQIAASGRLKLLPEQPAGKTAAPAPPPAAKDVAATLAAAPAGGARADMTARANAALETLAIGLRPGRSGGVR